MRARLLVFLTASLLSAADTRDHAGTKDLAAMQGSWVMVSCERDGTRMSAEEVKTYSRTVNGNKYTIIIESDENPRQLNGTIALDPTKKPKAIDAVRTDGPAKGQPMLGIYELDGNTQKVCFAPHLWCTLQASRGPEPG